MIFLNLDISSPIADKSTKTRKIIGEMAMMDENTVNVILNDAKMAWDNGNGEWPKLSAEKRIEALTKLVTALKNVLLIIKYYNII